jgi:hypothetical protein
VRFSTDSAITASDPLLATVAMSSLPPGSTQTVSGQAITIPAVASGTYYIGVLIDDVPATPDLDLATNMESVSRSVVEPAGPSPIVIDFETPSLGANDRQISNPYSVGYVSFTAVPTIGFPDAVAGLVKNNPSTSACVPPISANQTLGTGRSSFVPDGSIGLSPFEIRADFSTALNTAQTVSVNVQALGGLTVTIKLYNAGGTLVGSNSAVVPSVGDCGLPGGDRGSVTLTASGTQAKYAIISGPSGAVFVIDNFAVQDPIILF